MRKLFWVCWCLLILIFTGSYFRTAAIESQYSNTVWLQFAIADGGGRFVAVCGDPSASWTANTVIQRDKDGWRYVKSTALWGRAAYWESPVDTEGTIVGEYQIDMPFLGLLIVLLACIIAAKLIKRWWVSPRLVWAELWTSSLMRRGLFGVIRRALIVFSILLTLGSSLLWAGSYMNPLPGWRYIGDHFAFVMGRDYEDNRFYDILNTAVNGASGFRKAYDEINGQRIDEFGQPGLFFSVEIRRKRIAFSCYMSQVPNGTSPVPSRQEYAGVIFERNRSSLPGVITPFSHSLRPKMGGGLERTLVLRLWMLVILFGFWPVICFLHGPVRRARRRATGCCPPCGYNLTGLTEPRCPECGTRFEPQI